MSSPRLTLRRWLTLPTVIVALVVMLSTALAPALAARSTAPLATRMFVDRVAATATPTPAGTEVTTVFRVNNRTGKPVKAGRAKTYLMSATGEATLLGTVSVPRIKPGQKKSVRTTSLAADVAAGDYRVRVCLPPYPGTGHCAKNATRTLTVSPAVLTATPAAVTFTAPVAAPTRRAPAPETTQVVVRNTGQARSGQLTTTLTGRDAATFTVTGNTCSTSLTLGQQCSLTVVRPDAGAPLAATLTVRGADGASVAVPLSVTAAPVVPLRMTPTTYDFGDVAAGGSTWTTFVVVNDADVDQSLVYPGGTFATGANFSFDASHPYTCAGLVVTAHGSCTVNVAFNPTATGTATDVMTIYGPGGLLMTADLTGTGIACRACRAPATTAPELRSSTF